MTHYTSGQNVTGLKTEKRTEETGLTAMLFERMFYKRMQLVEFMSTTPIRYLIS